MNKKILATFTAGGVLIMCQAGLAATTSDLSSLLTTSSLSTTTLSTTTLSTTTLDTSVTTTDLSVDVSSDPIVVEELDVDSNHGHEVRSLARNLREHRHDRDAHREAVRELVKRASARSRDVRRDHSDDGKVPTSTLDF